jgi:hypothetical protein
MPVQAKFRQYLHFPGAQQAVLPKTVSHFLNYLFLDFQEKAKQFLDEQLVNSHQGHVQQLIHKISLESGLYHFL